MQSKPSSLPRVAEDQRAAPRGRELEAEQVDRLIQQRMRCVPRQLTSSHLCDMRPRARALGGGGRGGRGARTACIRCAEAAVIVVVVAVSPAPPPPSLTRNKCKCHPCSVLRVPYRYLLSFVCFAARSLKAKLERTTLRLARSKSAQTLRRDRVPDEQSALQDDAVHEPHSWAHAEHHRDSNFTKGLLQNGYRGPGAFVTEKRQAFVCVPPCVAVL
jgi:hypothetical protein